MSGVSEDEFCSYIKEGICDYERRCNYQGKTDKKVCQFYIMLHEVDEK